MLGNINSFFFLSDCIIVIYRVSLFLLYFSYFFFIFDICIFNRTGKHKKIKNYLVKKDQSISREKKLLSLYLLNFLER